MSYYERWDRKSAAVSPYTVMKLYIPSLSLSLSLYSGADEELYGSHRLLFTPIERKG